MPAVRHHTVSAFLLERFAIETKKGRRVCMLEKATGTPTLVSPRDATVRKHFYSIDVDDGTDPAVEDALSKIESLAAPLVTRLGAGDLPMGQERLDLATFVSMCWLRTPAWREQMASVMEQVTAAMAAESYRLDPEAAQRVLANSEFEMTRDEIEAFRRKFVDDLDAGRLRMEMPKNAMIGYFLHATAETAWLLTILDWTLVRLDGGAKELIIGDTPVSLYDSSPRFPGGGVGVLSSPQRADVPSARPTGRPPPAADGAAVEVGAGEPRRIPKDERGGAFLPDRRARGRLGRRRPDRRVRAGAKPAELRPCRAFRLRIPESRTGRSRRSPVSAGTSH